MEDWKKQIEADALELLKQTTYNNTSQGYRDAIASALVVVQERIIIYKSVDVLAHRANHEYRIYDYLMTLNPIK